MIIGGEESYKILNIKVIRGAKRVSGHNLLLVNFINLVELKRKRLEKREKRINAIKLTKTKR